MIQKDTRFFFRLFWATFSLSAFTVGGGYVIVPLMRKRFVSELNWISEDEMLDLVAIGQSTPGPIAVNTSILVGHRLAGVPGAAIALLGTVLPPLIILSVVSLFYLQFRDSIWVRRVLMGMQAAVVAVIIDVVISMGRTVLKSRQAITILILFAAFMVAVLVRGSLLWIILGCIIIGIARTLLRQRRAGQPDDGEGSGSGSGSSDSGSSGGGAVL